MDSSDNKKSINDPIHGIIQLHPLCVKIIDTPQFQRLRYLKQLGNSYLVYPGASHNRFEHSLGACHLAGKFVRELQARQPDLGIDEKDVLCVEIAGLCHDLGHGPFSHLFDKDVIPRLRGEEIRWTHEDASKKMFEFLIKENGLDNHFAEYSLTDKDKTFILELIHPEKEDSSKPWPYEGRGKDKSFLYQIVANEKNGIDVDKWDYFARDCHMLGIKNNFDHNRCIQFARVIEFNGEKLICFREKEAYNLYDMFHTRTTLHKRAYQHRVTVAIDHMVADAMVSANDHIIFIGENTENGKKEEKKMSEAIHDMKAYSQLTDYVFFQILYSTDKNLTNARKILQNVLSRKLYKCIGQTSLEFGVDKMQLKKKREQLQVIISETAPHLKTEDICVAVGAFGFESNSMENVMFFKKEKPDVAEPRKDREVSRMLSNVYGEKPMWVFCKKTDDINADILKQMKDKFVDWCNENNYPVQL